MIISNHIFFEKIASLNTQEQKKNKGKKPEAKNWLVKNHKFSLQTKPMTKEEPCLNASRVN